MSFHVHSYRLDQSQIPSQNRHTVPFGGGVGANVLEMQFLKRERMIKFLISSELGRHTIKIWQTKSPILVVSIAMDLAFNHRKY